MTQDTEEQTSQPPAPDAPGARSLAVLGSPGQRGVGAWLAEHRSRVLVAVAGLVVLAGLASLPINLGRALVGGVSTGAVYAMVALGIALAGP